MNALIIQGADALTVCEAKDVQIRKVEILTNAKLIKTVHNSIGQSQCAAARREIREMLSQVETSRKEVKAPVLKFERKIDDVARAFTTELRDEDARLGRLMDAYQSEIDRQNQERERQRQEELQRIENERIKAEAEAKAKAEADLAKAATLKERIDAKASNLRELDAIRQREIEAKAQAITAPARPEIKPAGIVVRHQKKYRVTNIKALFNAHPEFCDIQPKAARINRELADGMTTCPGLEIWEETKTGVRI